MNFLQVVCLLLFWRSRDVVVVCSEFTGNSATRREAAILLTGHVRTYARTAKSLNDRLVIPNRKEYDFFLFCLTYRSRDLRRGSDKSNHTAANGGPMTEDEIRQVYEDKFPSDRLYIDIVKDTEVKAEMPTSLRKQMSPKAPYRIKHRFRLNMMFRMIANAYAMIHRIERERNALFDLVIKLRFDLLLLSNFMLKFHWTSQHQIKPPYIVIVPHRFVSGTTQLSPNQIKTRPCNTNGTLRPTWVQDHVAYGTSISMALYTNGTDQFMRLHASSFFVPAYDSPEVILASVLKSYSISVKCDPALKYTILR